MLDTGSWQEGGWLWFVIDILAVLLLAAAMLYGSHAWLTRSRDPVVKRESDEATRRLYKADDNSP